MTEDNLVERLRGGVLYGDARLHNPKGHDPLRMEAADRIEQLTAEVERLREALSAYTEYCGVCHGRGSFIEEDATTGKDLWRDCPGCTPARAAAPALMEEGARLALEAAARIVNGWRECDWPEGYHPHAINEICEDRAMRVRALDPAAIVKGAGRDRD